MDERRVRAARSQTAVRNRCKPEAEARATFNGVAALYDTARPGYPEAVYDDLVALAGLDTNAHLLEIGSGTGHATLPLAQRGYSIDCIELGEQMASIARSSLANWPAVVITVANFDGWNTGTRYDLVFSASAWHWLDPRTRVQHIAALLAPAGHIAIFRNHHVHGEASASFNAAARHIYATTASSPAEKPRNLPSVEEIAPLECREWIASGIFAHAASRIYRWQQTLTAADYTRQLATHSDHLLLADADRKRMVDSLTHLIDDKFGGSVVKEYVTLLQVAQKVR